MKQGAPVVGIATADWVVLAAVKRSPGDLAAHQKKLIGIDTHIGIALSGLTSDSRILSTFMRSTALASKLNVGRDVPVGRLVGEMADKAQQNTLAYGNRPYGVGILVAGVDASGCHLYEFSPAGTCFKYHAMAIGARSQSARTYLEKHAADFCDAHSPTPDAAILHALKALRETLPSDATLSAKNCSVGVVGRTEAPFRILADAEVDSFLLQAAPSAPMDV